MTSDSYRMVPVDFSARLLHRGRDGSTSSLVFEKEFKLPAGAIEHGKTDRTYRLHLIEDMERRSRTEMMSLKPYWHCFSCQGDFHKFNYIPFGLTDTDENGRVPSPLFLIPVCSAGRCYTSSTQEFNSVLAEAAKATGTKRTSHPDRAIQICRKCDKIDGASEQFSQCSRCKEAYYCSRECQRDHWSIHKKSCLPPPS